MISCPKCGKENQDHYKFCLGCGNELPRDGHGPRPFVPTPPAGVPAQAGARAPAASTAGLGPPPGPPTAAALGTAGPFGGAAMPPQPAPAPAGPPSQAARAYPAVCPQCNSPNARAANRFCLTCGFDLASAPAPASPQSHAPAPAPAPASAPVPAPPPVAAPAPVAAPQQAAQAAPSSAKLTLIRPDGSEGGTFNLNAGTTLIGRETGAIFGGDAYLSPRHAMFSINGATASVRDESSLNGIYVRVERNVPTEIHDGDVFRIGQEILRYDAFKPVQSETDGTEKQGAQMEGLVGRVSLVVGRDVHGNAFPVPVTGLFLGRERGDILFPEDGYVSGLHCQLAIEGGRLMMTDLNSSNGTYVRLRGERTIKSNDLLLMGQQLFRLNL